MQIILTWLIHNTNVCKHYRGSYHIGLVLGTHVLATMVKITKAQCKTP